VSTPTTAVRNSTTEAPALSPGDIREQLVWLFARGHRSFLVALWGKAQAEAEALEVPEHGAFRIVPAPSELALRDNLPPIAERDARVVYLVPWAHELPLDIAGRFVLGGRVLPVGRNRRLLSRLGVSDAEPEALETALADYVLRHEAGQPISIASSRVTRDELWLAWLTSRVGFPNDRGVAPDSLFAWAASNSEGPDFFAGLKKQDGGAAVRTELLAWLEERLPTLAPVLWRAWEIGQGRAVAEMAVVLEAVTDLEDPAVATWLEMSINGTLSPALGTVGPAHFFAALRPHVGAGLALLRAAATNDLRRQVIDAADKRAGKAAAVAAAAAGSTRLRCAWQLRCETLGEALSAAAKKPTAATVRVAAAERAALEHHDYFQQQREPEYHQFKRAEMAVRLAAWLASPSAAPPVSPAASPIQDAELLAHWYCRHGGYVDWARTALYGEGGDELGAGIQAVTNAATTLRVALDRRFARGLKAWLEASRPSQALVPISQAFERVGGPYLDDSDSKDRRLLVLLFDGMGWMQAREILGSLAEETTPWCPLETQPGAPGPDAAGQPGSAAGYPAVIAELPTVTAVSRSAFFAGKSMQAGTEPTTSDDPKRWRRHAAVRKRLPQGTEPALFLRDKVCTSDGDLSADARAAVADKTQPAVAMVINAIDASLHADIQQVQSWTARTIRPLHSILEAAQEAGRAVMLVADHGHVWGGGLAAAPPPAHATGESKARWRPWHGEKHGDNADALEAHEIAVSGEHAWAPPGAEGVVLIADDQHRYGAGNTAGEHGGASLSEVVVPTVMLGWAGWETATAHAADDDATAGLRTRALDQPAWWRLDLSDIDAEPNAEACPQARAKAAKPKPKPSKSPKKEAQPPQEPPQQPAAGPLTATPGPAPATPSTQPSTPTTPRERFLQALRQTAMFRERVDEAQHDKVCRALRFLLQHDGAAPIIALAGHLGVAGYRMSGWVSKHLSEPLNVEGYLVVSVDPQAGRVVLDQPKLEQLFEVKP
jgi:hypothetical protein